MKKNKVPQPAPPSSEESGSVTSFSSSEGDLPSSNLSASNAGKKLPPPKKEKVVDSGRMSSVESSKVKKPISKSSLPAASPRTPAKRALSWDGEESKRPKKEKGGGGGAEEEGKKSTLFQRLWSDDDEIVILKGMLEYKEEKAADPMADANDFLDFIKESLHVKVDRKQMVNKIRRLRKRYDNSLSSNKRNFSAHERNAFDLSKKIWGHEVEGADVDQEMKSGMKTRKVLKAETGKGVGLSATLPTSGRNGDVSPDGKRELEDSDSGSDKEEYYFQFVGKSSIAMGLNENIVRAGLELCTQESKIQIEKKWKQLFLEESNLFIKKLELARQGSKMIIEALKSGD